MRSESIRTKETGSATSRKFFAAALFLLFVFVGQVQVCAEETTGVLVALPGVESIIIDFRDSLPIYADAQRPAPRIPAGLFDVVSVALVDGPAGSVSSVRCEVLQAGGTLLEWTGDQNPGVVLQNCRWLRSFNGLLAVIQNDGSLVVGTNIANGVGLFSGANIVDAAISAGKYPEVGRSVWAVTSDGRLLATQIFAPPTISPAPMPDPPVTNAVSVIYGGGSLGVLLSDGRVLFQRGSYFSNQADHLEGVIKVWGGPYRAFLLHTNGVLDALTPGTLRPQTFSVDTNFRQIHENDDYALGVPSDGSVFILDRVGRARPLGLESLKNVSAVASLHGVTLAVVPQLKSLPKLTYPLVRKAIEGYPMELEVSAQGVSTFSYRWLHDGVVLQGATNSLLSFPQFRKEFAGDYVLEVCSAIGCSTSQVIHVEALQPSAPRVWSVTSTESSGPGTLRELIQDANACGGGTILMNGLAGETRLDRPLPPIRSLVEIRGPGTNGFRLTGFNLPNALTITREGVCTISDLRFSEFITTSNLTATIENRGVLELRGCVLAHNSAPTLGGAIHSSGSLSMWSSVIDGNTLTQASSASVGSGVAILQGDFKAVDCAFVGNRVAGTPASGAAIHIRSGQCSLQRCFISTNQVQAFAHGFSGPGDIDASGAGIYSKGGEIELDGCLIADNLAVGAGGVSNDFKNQNAPGGSAFGGGVYLGGGRARISGCTVARNIAMAGDGLGSSGAGSAYGGGMSLWNTLVVLTNCTVSGNRAKGANGNSTLNRDRLCSFTYGSPAFGGGIALGASAADLVNCTVSENQVAGGAGGGPLCSPNSGTTQGPGNGGGVGIVPYVMAFYPAVPTPVDDSFLRVMNTIVAGNSGSGDIYGSTISHGGNLLGITNGTVGLISGDLWGVGADLEPLSVSASGMLVYRLRPSSVAIDSGVLSGSPSVDQLGARRPIGFGIDIGATEFTGAVTSRPPVLIAAPTDQEGLIGQPVTFAAEASGSPPLLCQWEFEGKAIPSETNLFLTLSSPTRYQDGNYRLRIRNSAGSTQSPPFRFTLRQPTLAEATQSIRKRDLDTFSQLDYLSLVTEGNGVLVAAGGVFDKPRSSTYSSPFILTSTNGQDWSQTLQIDDGYFLSAIRYSEGWFIAALFQGGGAGSNPCSCNRVALSANGKDWSLRELPYAKPLALLASVPGGFIATAQGCCGSNDVIWISTNLTTEVRTLGPGPAIGQAAFANGTYLLQSSAGALYRSTNRIDWSLSTNTLFVGHQSLDLIPWRGGFARLKNTDGAVRSIYLSGDGLDWTLFAQSTNEWVQLAGAPFGLGALSRGIAYSFFSVSSDGIHWSDIRWDSSRSGPPPYRFYGLTYFNHRWVAVGEEASVLMSADYEGADVGVHARGPGSVQKSPASGPIPYGQTVTLSATPAPWGRFARWSDWATNNPRVEITGVVNDYTAIFEPTTPLETLSFGGVSREAPVGMPAIILDGRLELGDAVTKFREVEIEFFSSFSNAPLAWSFDGSAPEIPLHRDHSRRVLNRSAVVRVAVFPDGGAPIEYGPLTITLQPGYRIQVVNPGGGSVRLIPSAEGYAPGTEVRVEASPKPGWQLMSWGDDSIPTVAQMVLKMDRDYDLRSVFGTPFTLTSNSISTTSIEPSLPLYPYGAQVQVTASPNPGYQHAFWYVDRLHILPADYSNPIRWTVTAPFQSLQPTFIRQGQDRSILASIDGLGRVLFDPNTNSFPVGTSVRLRAVPDPNQSFLGWDGDVRSSATEIVVVMNDNKRLRASFTRRPELALDWDPKKPGTLRLTVQSEIGSRHILESRAEETSWVMVKELVNSIGTIRIDESVSPSDSYRWYRLRSP